MKLVKLIGFCLVCTCFFAKIKSQVFVDTVNQISAQESAYINQRQSSVNSALLNFISKNKNYKLKKSLSKIPTVAFCFSGGGYRAMIAGAAFSLATSEIGLWNATSYMSVLSGSTWFLGPYLVRDFFESGGLDFSRFGQQLKKNIVNVNFFDPETLHLTAIAERLLKIYKSTGTIGMSDFWGAMLADRLLSDLQADDYPIQNIGFSNIQALLEQIPLKYPFPIFTASIVEQLAYQWMEINPFVSGGDTLMNHTSQCYGGAYIPTEYMGSIFSNGQLMTKLIETSVAGFIGICGSPYSLSAWDIFKFVDQFINSNIDSVSIKTLEAIFLVWLWQAKNEMLQNLAQIRILPINFNNFTCGMANAVFGAKNQIWLCDAGEINNLPFSVLLKNGRTPDVIVVCDASSDSGVGYREMVVARNQIVRLGMKNRFPSIKNPVQINENLYIFKSKENPTIPTIVYFSLPRAAHVPTLHFDYTEQEFDNIFSAMHDLIVENVSTIQAEIISKSQQFNKNTSSNSNEPVKSEYIKASQSSPHFYSGAWEAFKFLLPNLFDHS